MIRNKAPILQICSLTIEAVISKSWLFFRLHNKIRFSRLFKRYLKDLATSLRRANFDAFGYQITVILWL